MSLRLSILSIVLLACAGAVAAWLMRAPSVDSRSSLDSTEISAPATSPADVVELETTEDAETDGIEEDSDREGREAASLVEPVIEPGEALWVEGRVIFPDDTPPGERVEVVAEGIRSASKGVQHALVSADGSFRVGFAPGTKKGELRIRSPFLYLEPEVNIDPSKPPEDLVLMPKLGGCIRGRLVIPPESREARRSLHNGRVRVSNSSPSDRPDTVPHYFSTTRLSAALEFECPGLPPGDHYIVELRSRGEWCTTSVEEVRVIAGRITRADLNAFPGVRIAGRVVDEHGAPVSRAKVEAWRMPKNADESQDARAAQTGRPLRAARSLSDGKFLLSGVEPGELYLVASDSRSMPTYFEIGAVGADKKLEDVSIVLRAELSISGLVRWPDGPLATKSELRYDCQGELPIGVPEWKRKGSLEIEDGRFDLPVAGPGPWALTARAHPTRDPARSPDETSKTWVAHARDLQAGTIGVVLTLAPSHSIRGRLLDDSGVPLHVQSMLRVYPASGSSAEWLDTFDGQCQPDGSFELGGLHPGSWRIDAFVYGYAAVSPTVVEVPGNGGAVELTLSRTGTISGLVVDSWGQPVAGARVSVELVPKKAQTNFVDGITTWRDNADDAGRFSVERISPGSLVIVARYPDRGNSSPLEVQLSPGQHLENLELFLLPPAK